MSLPVVFRIPSKKRALKEYLSARGFSFIKHKIDEDIAYQSKHWSPGYHGNFGLALDGASGLRPLTKEAALLIVAATGDAKAIKRALAEASNEEMDPANVDLDGGYGIEFGEPYEEFYDDDGLTFDMDYDHGPDGDFADGFSIIDQPDLTDGYGSGYSYMTYEGKRFGRVGVADLDDISDGLTRLGKNYEDEIVECISDASKTDKKLTEGFKQSQSKKGNIKILLDESDHIEWSLMNKLTKTFHSVVTERRWLSSDQKVRTLCKESSGGKLRGVPASEALTVGGRKNLMWVDIDTYDIKSIKEWLNTQKLFKKGSYALVESSTGKSHLYVVTNILLKERWQKKMRQLIRESMPNGIKRKLDRVYGPESRRAIFLPNTTILEASLPQDVVASCNETFTIPVGRVENLFWKKL